MPQSGHAVERLAQRHVPGVEASDQQIVLELRLECCLDVSLARFWAGDVDVLELDLEVLVKSQATREVLVLHVAHAVVS